MIVIPKITMETRITEGKMYYVYGRSSLRNAVLIQMDNNKSDYCNIAHLETLVIIRN